MNESDAEPPYVARYGVAPTREQFEAACRRLEAHLADLKRVKFQALGLDILGAELVRYHKALQRYKEFSQHEVCGFMRDWWRLDPIEDVDRVRRRANRQQNLASKHLFEIKGALVARGSAGIEVIRKIFLTGEDGLVWFLYDVAVEHFPDDAEPVLETLVAQLDDGDLYGWHHRRNYQEALQMIRGYRARRERALAPELAQEPGPGLAPALSTLDKSPADFPALLFERFATHVFTGELVFHAAVNAAWRQVVTEKSLDPTYYEQAELAEFDPKFRDQLAGVVLGYYGNGPYAQHLEDHHFMYWHSDGSPVTLEQLHEALMHVCRMSRETPYHPAKTWKGAP